MNINNVRENVFLVIFKTKVTPISVLNLYTVYIK